jgi:DNA helicase-2/ATP-dependent DNA helicase PcrA
MDAFAFARHVARERHAAARDAAGGRIEAAALAAAGAALAGLTLCAVEKDADPCLRGAEAVLDPALDTIFFKKSASPATAAFQQAHELGHHWLDGRSAHCDADDLIASDADPASAEANVGSYSPKQRRECQANVFARHFLLPADSARALFLAGDSAADIVSRCGLPPALVTRQLIEGLLLPPAVPFSEPAAAAAIPLDASQSAAAHCEAGPLLLEAGPGTGKTRTLIGRVEYLLAQGVAPVSILILTFSRKAAEELRARIASAAPDAATQIWAGTFHAIGLELLRLHGDKIGLPADPRPADGNETMRILESLLPSLPLDHYLSLHEPTQGLAAIAKAISRAKDELVDAAGYRRLGLAMPEGDDEAIAAREKVLEIADIYEAYDAAMAADGRLDFGDLIMRCCALLERRPDVAAALAAQWPHILVDEFQDVNRASALFLKGLAGKGEGLWVVGDARQSIYRFRGAAPDNIHAFEQDYPGAKRLALAVNYRSHAPIVGAFATFAGDMAASRGAAPQWTANRGAGPAVDFHIADTAASEAQGLAASIRAIAEGGIAYRDQAILCRSHTGLARIARYLEQLDIPILYLGDIFERAEVRDLLSLLSLAAEPASSGLVRVAGFPDYDLGLDDCRRLLDAARTAGLGARDAVIAADPALLSADGRAGLVRLSADLAAIDPRQSAAAALEHYLFEHRRWFEPLLGETGVRGAQKRLALYQLIEAARSYAEAQPAGGIRGFLDWVRRLELLGDERQLRTPPAAASMLDAVRLMTVHASKGLEFDAVHLPGLATGQFPASRQYDPCPPPPGLAPRTPDEVRLEEEECLFFVALSRARRHLTLARAKTYAAARGPSPFLTPIAGALPRAPDASPDWAYPALEGTSFAILADCAHQPDRHNVEDLDQYLRCPRAYLYQRILGLNGGREDNGYVRFHRALYGVIRELGELAASGDPDSAARAALADAWQRIGPVGHPFEPIYWRQAERVLERALAHWRNANPMPELWDLSLAGTSIRVRPDLVERRDGRRHVFRLRTGRAPRTPPDDDLYALYHRAAPEAAIGVHYFGDDRRHAVAMTDRVIANRLVKYEAAIAGIASGDYPARPSERDCPRCPQFFVCASPQR